MLHVIKKSVFAIIILVEMSAVEPVAYNGLCNVDSECLETNANTTCNKQMTPTCLGGKCACAPIFYWDSSAEKCKLKKFYLDRCIDSETYCTEATTCIQGQCKCTGGGTFNDVLRMCTLLKATGENCGSVTDCYSDLSNSVECEAPTGSSQTVCACKSGYKEIKGKCRIPRNGDLCTTSVGCESPFTSYDSSIATETCGSVGTCTCPSTSTSEKLYEDGRIYQICLTSPTQGSTQFDILDVCTKANDCSSKVCLTCAESMNQNEKKCVAQPSL